MVKINILIQGELITFYVIGVSITIPNSYSKNMLPNETLTEVNIGKLAEGLKTFFKHQNRVLNTKGVPEVSSTPPPPNPTALYTSFFVSFFFL